MSLHVVPNSGLFNNESLDRLRGEALTAFTGTEIPEVVVYYLRALESEVLSLKAEQKRRFATETGWRFKGDQDHD